MATNGVYSVRNALTIAHHFSGVSLSHDGPRTIFDAHRPMRNGASGFTTIMRTARLFEREKLPFALRSTVSSLTLQHQEEFFSFFENEFPGHPVGLEPLNPQGRGRGLRGEVQPPSEDGFTAFLKAAYRRSLTSGFQFRNSTIGKFDILRTTFCMSIAQPAMTVLPTGEIVACTRAEAGGLYSFGRISEDGQIALDTDAADRIRSHTVLRAENCRDCFCKYNCGGGCTDLRLTGNLRCETTRGVGMMILRSRAGLPLAAALI
jgi:radical SAM protein with 4Fe4S-binding SPASM domain